MLLGCMENQTTLGPSSAKSVIRRGRGQVAGWGGQTDRQMGVPLLVGSQKGNWGQRVTWTS